jgi:hypothetical protein
MRLGEPNEMAAQKVKIYIEGKRKQQRSISKDIAILHIRTQGKGRNSIYKEISSRIFFFGYIRLGRQTHK